MFIGTGLLLVAAAALAVAGKPGCGSRPRDPRGGQPGARAGARARGTGGLDAARTGGPPGWTGQHRQQLPGRGGRRGHDRRRRRVRALGPLPAELAAMGRTLDDVRAIVLTHGHSDHIGFAERARRERGWPVRVHELDAALAKGEVKNPAKAAGRQARRDPRSCGGRPAPRRAFARPRCGEVATFGDGATLDVPGSPRVILVPGHTPGSAALHFAGHDAALVGDAMATYAVTTGAARPADRAVQRGRGAGAGIARAARGPRRRAGSCPGTATPSTAASTRPSGSPARRRCPSVERGPSAYRRPDARPAPLRHRCHRPVAVRPGRGRPRPDADHPGARQAQGDRQGDPAPDVAPRRQPRAVRGAARRARPRAARSTS